MNTLKINGVVVGKRVTVGAALTSSAIALGEFFPDHSTAIMSLSVPLTLFIQIYLANKVSITT